MISERVKNIIKKFGGGFRYGLGQMIGDIDMGLYLLVMGMLNF